MTNPEFMVDGKYCPSHDEIQRISKEIGYEILGSGLVVVDLVAVTRGGLNPMGFISRMVHWSRTETIDLKSYVKNSDGTESSTEMNVTKRPKLNSPTGAGALFVDDVLDTGGTARYLRYTYPDANIAVVYSKMSPEESTEYVDFVGEYAEDIWINFPWEMDKP
ncbi:MAG: phosphoribosyltransferase family protein [Patescibacteria group bacterium]